jgi:hypothetical protein
MYAAMEAHAAALRDQLQQVASSNAHQMEAAVNEVLDKTQAQVRLPGAIIARPITSRKSRQGAQLHNRSLYTVLITTAHLWIC